MGKLIGSAFALIWFAAVITAIVIGIHFLLKVW